MSEENIFDKQAHNATYLVQSSKKRKDVSEFEESTNAGTEQDASSTQSLDLEEAIPLLHAQCREDLPAFARELFKNVHASLDVFKGILVVIMTLAHTDLVLMDPAIQYVGVPHAIGNLAASVCLLGFMLSYGFSCDYAYFSEMKRRPAVDRLKRMLRSAALPVLGAWVCAFGWGWMFFKMPMEIWTVIHLLDFRITLGNGPDFLLCFTVALLVTYPLRHALNMGLSRDRSILIRIAFAIIMLLVPMKLTQIVIEDCTGLRKYAGYFLECTKRDPFAPVLPALPHLFYFNMGIILSRVVVELDGNLKSGYRPDKGMLISSSLFLAMLLSTLSYPLITVWASNYGNVMEKTRWGMVTRGFVEGPSVLWLLGNIFPVTIMFVLSCSVHVAARFYKASNAIVHWVVLAPLRWFRDEMAFMGSNVLLYFVVADLCLAGLYRGKTEMTLPLSGTIPMTIGILAIVRFLHYLSAAGRGSS